MSNTWSTKIQGINTLNLHREIRFTDKTFMKILDVINVKKRDSVIDLGCGPGTFTRKLSVFYPDASITGLDFDSNFIKFCKSQTDSDKLANVKYIQGDALNTSFEDNYFDICTSHTVIEHLPNYEFLKEQFRILKPGGKVVVLNTRADFALKSQEKIEPCDRESTLLDKVGSVLEDFNKKNKVALYSANPQEILKTMETVGFKELQIDTVPYVTCLDDTRNSMEYKLQILESERQSLLEYIEMALNENPIILASKELAELRAVIYERFNKRIMMIENGENIWDLSITPTIIMIGRKPI